MTSSPPVKTTVTTVSRHDDLHAMLRRLNLSHSAETFAETALKAAKANLSHEAFLYELASQECAFRTQRRIARHLQESRLPREKTFTALQLDRFSPALQLQIERLRTGAFVEEAVNVVAVGRPGVGKSHLAAALGHELIQLGHTVLWTTTAAFVQRLLAAKRDLRLPQQLAKLEHVACLILDDIGYVQHDRDEMEVLFTLLTDRYERRSVCQPRHEAEMPASAAGVIQSGSMQHVLPSLVFWEKRTIVSLPIVHTTSQASAWLLAPILAANTSIAIQL